MVGGGSGAGEVLTPLVIPMKFRSIFQLFFPLLTSSKLSSLIEELELPELMPSNSRNAPGAGRWKSLLIMRNFRPGAGGAGEVLAGAI